MINCFKRGLVIGEGEKVIYIESNAEKVPTTMPESFALQKVIKEKLQTCLPMS